jgi:hypothetical protein
MEQERIIETTDANGTIVEHAYERDAGPANVTVNTAPTNSGGGFSAVMALLLLAAVAVGGYLVFTNNGSEARKDTAAVSYTHLRAHETLS